MSSESAKSCPQCGRTYGAHDRFCTVDGAALIASGTGTIVGTVLADRFLVQQKLGEGGMGEVYLAEHVRMKRKVALKLMRPWMIGDPVAVNRFHREAENASQITHPNVAQVYDFGETSDGLVYLAMEFVDGEPLSSVLEREQTLPCVRSAEIVRQVGEALTAAHTYGILHRDLKPDNVMVARTKLGTDIVKLVDFGIARAMDRSTQQFTSTGMIVGTPDYMSPEQLSGDKLDGRSDLYALALIAYRILTGQGAFPNAGTHDALIARLTSPPRQLVAVAPQVTWPVALQSVFDRALASDPEHRYAEPMEFVAEFDAAISSMELTPADHEYLAALSARRPTPVRGGAVLEAATPSRAMTPVAMPVNQTLATLPLRPMHATQADSGEQSTAVMQPAASPWSGELAPLTDPVVRQPADAVVPKRRKRPAALGVGALALVAAVAWLASRNRPAVAPQAIDTTSLPAPVTSAPETKSGSVDVLPRANGATVAVWAGDRRGSGVLVESSGMMFTSTSLVRDAAVIDVFLDATTRTRATLLAVDSVAGIAAFVVPVKSCRRCEIAEPDSALQASRGDSLVAVPASGRADGTALRLVTDSVAAGAPIIAGLSPRLVDGTPFFSARSGALVTLATRRRGERTTLISTTALRDLRVRARTRLAQVVPNDTLYPTWPVQPVPAAALTVPQGALAEALAPYRISLDGLSLVAMTPSVLRLRDSLGAQAAQVAENPFAIDAKKQDLAMGPDPIRSWSGWRETLSERRAVVILNVGPDRATFPELPSRVVDLRRGNIVRVELRRDNQLVLPIDVSYIDAVGNAAAYRAQSRSVPKTALAIYAPSEFQNTTATYEFVVEEADRPGRLVTFKLPPQMVAAIAGNFRWLTSSPR